MPCRDLAWSPVNGLGPRIRVGALLCSSESNCPNHQADCQHVFCSLTHLCPYTLCLIYAHTHISPDPTHLHHTCSHTPALTDLHLHPHICAHIADPTHLHPHLLSHTCATHLILHTCSHTPAPTYLCLHNCPHICSTYLLPHTYSHILDPTYLLLHT